MLLPKAFATGIAAYQPPHKTNYVPNSEPYFEFGITYSTMDVELFISGYLSEYATLSRQIIKVDDTNRRFIVSFKFPDEDTFIKPGHHRVGVGFSELVGKSGTVGTALIGSTFIEIDVLYPGKYVEAGFEAPDVNSNETSAFVFIAYNFGKENISSIYGLVDTYDLDGNKIDTVLTNTYELESDKRRQLYARKPMEKHKPGNYLAKAMLYWDENTTYFEDYFRVGKLRVDLLNYTRSFNPNTINRFDLQVKSVWNNEVKNLYAEMFLMHENQSIITSFKTPLTSLEPWAEKNLTVFWQAPDLALKTYKLKIKLYYDSESSIELGEITALEAERPFRINYAYLVIGLLVIVVLVLIVDIIWIVKKRR
jgi:hypothetical protein